MPVCSAGSCGRLVQSQSQGQVADARMTVAARPLHGRGKRVRVDRVKDLFERHANLETGQVRAEAEVRAVTEGKVRVGLTPQEEGVRLVEAPRVPVRRTLPHHHLLSGADAFAAELAGSGRRPALGR